MSEVVDQLSLRLAERGLTLAAAESCTGGLLAARLTDRPGASRVFTAGLVTYSDQAKIRLLGVRAETLAAEGAVSEAVAREMLTGALARTGADVGLAITGIAGPEGGTPEKPVGTVWIAASVSGRTVAIRWSFDGDRNSIREEAVRTALQMVDRLLVESE